LGLSRPAWIVQVFALQNVFAWLAMSVVLRRWFDLTTVRGVSLWRGALFSSGLICRSACRCWTVRACSTGSCRGGCRSNRQDRLGRRRCRRAGTRRTCSERNWVDPRAWSNRRAVLRQVGLLMLALAPLAIWFDYIHSIYRSLIFTSGETLARPFAWLLWRAQMVVREATSGSADHALRSAALVIAFVTQLATVAARPRLDAAWWRIGVAYGPAAVPRQALVGGDAAGRAQNRAASAGRLQRPPRAHRRRPVVLAAVRVQEPGGRQAPVVGMP
jgi:hypothetical protein